ncbi:MAG TPA: arsenic resistance N-acetyltransferase ArsN2 [Bacteroidota bacterium]|nr:arsenic resistance N-acetyltransferase ArsN2 [Bacteroidota bacterium]
MNAEAIERALPDDAGEIEELLKASGLPVEGASAHLDHFYVARKGDSIAGVIGLEPYGEDGLLRSLAVREPDRSKGIGNRLYTHLLGQARLEGIRRLVLLTTTAESYFAARGFRHVPAETIAGPIRQSAEFRGACPSSAACMELVL